MEVDSITSAASPLINDTFLPYRAAANYLSEILHQNNHPMPLVGIICGSGLSGLSNAMDEPKTAQISVKYSKIPAFPKHCTVEGHKGEVVFGTFAGVPTICFRGRFHSYEGYDMKTVVLPVHVMRCLCVKVLIVTNAAGGLNPNFHVGDLVCVKEHFALPHLTGMNSLMGPNDNELGPRFPSTGNTYDEHLRKTAQTTANTLNMNFFKPHGTYCFVSGPMFESKPEGRFLQQIGGDCVGMSTVPEVVAANHCGLKVLCLSLITNEVIVENDASHEKVLEAVSNRSEQIELFVREIIKGLGDTKFLETIPDLSPISLDKATAQFQKQKQEKRDKIKSRLTISFRTLVFGATCLTVGSLATTALMGKRRV